MGSKDRGGRIIWDPATKAPRIIDTQTLARLLSQPGDPWDARRVRRRFGAAFTKDGGRWITTVPKLCATYSTLGRLVLEYGDVE